jgi:hypothetical protein
MRKKLKLAFMVSDFARRITYNKRKKSLTKNYSEPELWPSPWEVQRIITKYKNYSEFEQCIKKLNHKSYLMQRITKYKEQLEKLEENDWRMEKSSLISY